MALQCTVPLSDLSYSNGPIDAPASILEESGVDASDDESVGDQEHEQSPAQSAAASTIAVALAAAAHADQATAKKKAEQIHWKFKPAARTFFRIIEHVKPKGNAGWEVVAAHLRQSAAEFNRDTAPGDNLMCRGALTCKGDQLQRRFKALLMKPKPTGNPVKGWDIVEAHRLAEIIREDAHQGMIGDRTYVETHTQIEQGSLSADGKRKLSDASDAASHIKKSGGSRFFKALEDRDLFDRDRHAALIEVTNRQMEPQSRQHKEYLDSVKAILGKFIDKF